MKSLKIVKKTTNENVKPVYDIEVENDHHYILENGVISHNSGPIFAASQVVAMKKLKLKEDEKGNKITDVTGIRSAVKVVKSRFSKPFESVQMKIPYETGLDPYSGLFDLFQKKGIIEKSGNKWVYVDKEGNEYKYFEKAFSKNENNVLDKIMEEWDEISTKYVTSSDEMDDKEE